jgi:hypothetical protein
MAAAAVLFGLVLSLGAIEIVPRLLPGAMPRKVQSVLRLYEARSSWESMMRGDPELGFTLKPGLELSFPSEGRQIPIRTRALDGGPPEIGFRDLGVPGPYDAVALGDSFTFCDDSTAEGCWVRRLGSDLGIRIATLGVNGYSNLAEARLLAKVAPSLGRVRLVLAGFFPNDFKDNLHFHNWSRSGTTDDYWTWQRRNRRSDVSEFLADWSVTWRLVDAARRYGARSAFEHHGDGLDFVFTGDAWWRTVLDRPGQTPGFHLAEQAFADMAATVKGMDARFVVLLFPFKEQVYWPVVRRYYAGDPDLGRLEESDIDAPFAALRRSLEARGIEVCDLTPALRRAAATRPQLYLRAGAHWTEEGNAATAEAVADCLKEKGGLKGQDGLAARTVHEGTTR